VPRRHGVIDDVRKVPEAKFAATSVVQMNRTGAVANGHSYARAVVVKFAAAAALVG